MYLAVFIYTTVALGSGMSPDPQGPSQTLEACYERLDQAAPRMIEHLMQFDLQELRGECQPDDSQAI